MSELIYSIIGLSEFNISFENWCVPCKFQGRCRYGKKEPLALRIDCNDLLKSFENERRKQIKKEQKKADINDDYEKILSRVKVNNLQIFSGVWKMKIKNHKEDILCLNSKKTDSMVTSQRGGEWWQEFTKVMREIYIECKKII
ncbi:MAG: hypothetical protein ACTSWY_10745 [Promethearchaeota archaeon]